MHIEGGVGIGRAKKFHRESSPGTMSIRVLDLIEDTCTTYQPL